LGEKRKNYAWKSREKRRGRNSRRKKKDHAFLLQIDKEGERPGKKGGTLFHKECKKKAYPRSDHQSRGKGRTTWEKKKKKKRACFSYWGKDSVKKKALSWRGRARHEGRKEGRKKKKIRPTNYPFRTGIREGELSTYSLERGERGLKLEEAGRRCRREKPLSSNGQQRKRGRERRHTGR